MNANERRLRGFTLTCVFVLAAAASALAQQFYLPPPPPTDPSDYGKVILNNFSSKTGSPGGVVFDHWLHRSKYSCRLCHVDIGFAMEANATGVTAESNRQGFHCGTCHNGTRLTDGHAIFASCTAGASDAQCLRCHSVNKTGVRKFVYQWFTAKFPKDIYGIDWERAEATRIVKPEDYLEGVSARRARMQSREDFGISTGAAFINPITFSHAKHSIWNGCELCHPEIFSTAQRSQVHYTMFSNVEGKHCGACHLRVAFPLNNCQKCHPSGPRWWSQR